MAKLMGTTKIELTDVKTGEKEVYENHNMVTNALTDIFRPLGLSNRPNRYFSEFVPYYQTLLGGILCFDKEIPENPDDYYPPADASLIGCAAYGVQNNTKNTCRGGFNQTESEVNLKDRYVKYVYDFATSQAMVVLFIRSIGTAFHTPALNAVTPLLVPEEQLTKCAGYSQSLQSISYIVSPAVAALLYSVWDLNTIIAIDVLGAVIASITVAIVRIPKLGDQVQSLEPNFIREMKEGIVVLRQNKGLFALLLLGTLYTFVYMPINALYYQKRKEYLFIW